MKDFFLVVIILAASIGFLVYCVKVNKSPGEVIDIGVEYIRDSPERVVKDFVKTASDGKVDEAYIRKVFSQSIVDDFEKASQSERRVRLFSLNVRSFNQVEWTSIEWISITDVAVDGNKARVRVVISSLGKDERHTFYLVKEKGWWKINDVP